MARVTVVETNGSTIVRDYETDERAFVAYNLNMQVPRTEYLQVTKNDGTIVRWLNPVVGGKPTQVRGTKGNA